MLNIEFLQKVATVLEAAAAHIDAAEAAKIAAVEAEKQTIINTLASKYAEATGEEMPDNVRNKLANADGDVVDLVKSMIEKQASNVDSLGAPSTKKDGNVVLTKKEAAVAAEERFGNWLIS